MAWIVGFSMDLSCWVWVFAVVEVGGGNAMIWDILRLKGIFQ